MTMDRPKNLTPEFVDEDVAAQVLGFEVGTLRQWRTKGGGPPYYKLTRGNKQGAVRYNIPECIEWMQQFRRNNTSE
jgi:hypothetical protein